MSRHQHVCALNGLDAFDCCRTADRSRLCPKTSRYRILDGKLPIVCFKLEIHQAHQTAVHHAVSP